jgi:hypothetical protein
MSARFVMVFVVVIWWCSLVLAQTPARKAMS